MEITHETYSLYRIIATLGLHEQTKRTLYVAVAIGSEE